MNYFTCGLVVGATTLGVLIWYAIETKRLRIAAQDQLEGLAKPCLTLLADLREVDDAVLSTHDAVGITVVAQVEHRLVIHNIGTGVAINVQYVFRDVTDTETKNNASDSMYILNISADQKIGMPEPAAAHSFSHELDLRYESIGRKTYRSIIRFDHWVLTKFKFELVEK